MGHLVCYHHANCGDRPAVAECSVCGKGLCVECVDTLRSRKTGRILCVDCLNKELSGMENNANRIRDKRKSELVGMIVGAVIGIILAIVLVGSLGALALFVPFVCASFFTILRYTFSGYGFFIGLLIFVALTAISPIMLIVRVLSRLKERKELLEYTNFIARTKEANRKYYAAARALKTGNVNAAMAELIQKQKETQRLYEVAMMSQNSEQMQAIKKELDDVKAQVSEEQQKQKENEKNVDEIKRTMKKQSEDIDDFLALGEKLAGNQRKKKKAA